MAKKRNDDWDNGMTVAPMTGEELPKYRQGGFSNRERRQAKGKIKSDVTKKEQRAMIKALFSVMLPRLIVILAGFSATALLIWFWLK